MNHLLSQSLKPIIVWFRQDLRIIDQPALLAAIQKGHPIIPLYIWAPEEEGKWAMGSASKWWLHHSLISLQEDLKKLKLNLIIRQEASLKSIIDIIEETEAHAVFFNRCYEPAIIRRDILIHSCLQKKGIEVRMFNGSLLYEPWAILNKQNQPFKVFTHFWKHCLKSTEINSPLELSSQAISYHKKIASTPIISLELLPKIHWDQGLIENWQPGEKNAHIQLKKAIETVVPYYMEQRDCPSLIGTSFLSPYLHFGEISPHSVWHTIKSAQSLDPLQAEAFLRQLGWREFGYYLLYHFPDTPEMPLYEKFSALSWRKDIEGLKAWQHGLTGYPLVDAGMRQLWKTGWMHNRVRMLVGSFLVKDLLIHWQEGEKWFWDTLVDADLANNTLGWQWVSGCGADAAPYFRIFNPVTQSEKFDKEGIYIKKWIPELSKLPSKWIHRPWEAPEEVLIKANIKLGIDYPEPILNHDKARLRALEAFSRLKFSDDSDRL